MVGIDAGAGSFGALDCVTSSYALKIRELFGSVLSQSQWISVARGVPDSIIGREMAAI